MAEAFTVAVPVPAERDADEFEGEASDLFNAALSERGLVAVGEPRLVLLPHRPLVSWPVRVVETNGGVLPRPVTADGPAWQYTALVEPIPG